jgi:uncharacterized membrane protein YqgA involved in biofilm formation
VKGKLFFVSFTARPRHNRFVTGPFLNACGILLGSLFGLARRDSLAARTQQSFQSALGAFTAFCGLHLIWLNVDGGAGRILKQLFIALLAVVLGNLLGKALSLQKISNYFGQHAAKLLAAPENNQAMKPADGFIAVSILFCAAPLGIIGAVTDGLGGYYLPLVLKAVMDGLAMTSFVKMFRWPVALAALPVLIFQNGLAHGVHAFVLPWLAAPEWVQAINVAAGLNICAATLVILGVRRVELANYLPSLAVAPLMTKWLL